MPEIKIINNDCLIALKEYQDNYFDSVVTDPPYGISFMGKSWDYQIPSVELWKEVFRVLKPGGHILAACGTRTQHRMAVNIEDAGFEIRDIISWIYGSGFPKALDISMAIDKHFNKDRDIVGKRKHPTLKDTTKTTESRSAVHNLADTWSREWDITELSTDEAKKWNGWKTALKPAQELWTLARKPLSEKTVAENILKWGTGGINIDDSRIPFEKGRSLATNPSLRTSINGGNGGNIISHEKDRRVVIPNKQGRFPANVIFDEEAGKMFDEQSGVLKSGDVKADGFNGEYKAQVYGKYANNTINPNTVYADEGGASRFFYCAKASRSERNKGLEDPSFQKNIGHNRFDKCKTCGKYILQNPDRPSACKCDNPIREDNVVTGNFHPTVKPIKLLSYLVRLITPPNGIVLDPFNGSGSCGIACKVEGFNYVGIEREKEYCEISEARIKAWDSKYEENNDDIKSEKSIKSNITIKKESNKEDRQINLF